jgi:predicted nucleic acid-binding protein
MARVLLDTTILIDVLRGRPGALWRLRKLRSAGDTPFVCAVSVEETVRGLHAAEHGTAADLLRGLRTAPLGKDEGRQAGTWRGDYSRRGRTLAQADCLIAASALSIGGRLATGNPKHFPMRELTVEHWPVGE